MVPVHLPLHHRICPRCRSSESLTRWRKSLSRSRATTGLPPPTPSHSGSSSSRLHRSRSRQYSLRRHRSRCLVTWSSASEKLLRESRPTRVPAQHLSLAICQMVPWLFRRCSRRWRATQQCRYVMMVLLKCRSQSLLPVDAANATLRQRCDAVAARRLTFAVRPAPMRRGSTVGSALMARRRRHTMELLYLCNGRHILLPAGLSCSGPAVHAQLQIARSDSVMGLVRWAMAASSTSAPRRASSGVHVRT